MATESRIRFAYELGRLRLGGRRALAVLPLAGLALALGDDWRAVLLLAVATQLVVIGLSWSGGAVGRAVWPGLLAGAVPLILPLLALSTQAHACQDCAPSDAVHAWCVIACVVGGLTAGAVLGWRAARVQEGRLPFAAGAAVITALVGAMGCATLGLVGLIGAIGGLLVGGFPILVFRPGKATR